MNKPLDPRYIGPPKSLSDVPDDAVFDRPIGELLAEGYGHGLTPEQIERTLAYQREHRIRFGEAAVALRLTTTEEVVRALSRQFHYHYAPVGRRTSPELVMANEPFSSQVEVFRDLRSQLLEGPNALDSKRRCVAVTSADSGDGRTFVAANLAVAFAQLPGRTLLIDGDMRAPRLQQLFGLKETALGLSSVLAGRTNEMSIGPVVELPNLFVMPVGALPPNPLELLQRPAFELLLQELCDKFDHVVVDTPAAARGSDARMIAARCGAALVVGRRGHTRSQALRDFIGQLTQGPTKMAGVVMNDF